MDTYSMIKKAARELELIDYNLNRCVQTSLANFVKLKICSVDEL